MNLNSKSNFKKKGNAPLDVIFILVVLFCFSMVVILAYPAFTSVKDAVVDDPGMSADAKTRITGIYDKYPAIFDYGFLLILILLWAFALISSFFVDSHPAFFIIVVIVLVIVLWVSAELANVHYDLANDEDFQDIVDQTPITNYVMQHLFELFVIISFTIVVAMITKVTL